MSGVLFDAVSVAKSDVVVDPIQELVNAGDVPGLAKLTYGDDPAATAQLVEQATGLARALRVDLDIRVDEYVVLDAANDYRRYGVRQGRNWENSRYFSGWSLSTGYVNLERPPESPEELDVLLGFITGYEQMVPEFARKSAERMAEQLNRTGMPMTQLASYARQLSERVSRDGTLQSSAFAVTAKSRLRLTGTSVSSAHWALSVSQQYLDTIDFSGDVTVARLGAGGLAALEEKALAIVDGVLSTADRGLEGENARVAAAKFAEWLSTTRNGAARVAIPAQRQPEAQIRVGIDDVRYWRTDDGVVRAGLSDFIREGLEPSGAVFSPSLAVPREAAEVAAAQVRSQPELQPQKRRLRIGRAKVAALPAPRPAPPALDRALADG
jgi:hypothetical protein